MDKKQAIKLVEQTFPQSFEKEQFHRFVKELLNRMDDSPERQSRWAGKVIKQAYQDYVNHYERLGTYTDPEGRKLDVLVIHLKKDTTLERGRTRLRNFAADYLSTGHGNDKDAVLVAYVSPEEDDWRFSFVKLEYALEQDEAGKVKVRKELTPARRYSFLVGANERSHTAQKQFLPLLTNDQSDPSLAEIEEAFNIEKVTKEFFRRYRELFEKTKAALEDLIKRDAKVRAEFKDKAIDTDDFAKKLLGQIVFLYFLQKKGWFGVERDAAWGTGDKNYLRYLFENREHLGKQQGKAKKQAVNFFNDILEHLFYEALATERTNHYYGRFDCRIPFLNGGLFEPLQDYRWESVDILLPDELFSNHEPTKEGDVGTGILDVFDRYNFTVNEAEPLETEVAVDPEMLGKVFENLLPENLRYKGGTYYTPRVIVNYLCQQSLINYLSSRLEGKVSRDDIETFITRGEVLREFEANQRKNEENRLPETVREHSKAIDRLLAEITVCDPAIGSGAFPVGMMQEIVKARLTLTFIDGMPAYATYELKRHAIESSLYGVDIDPGAIEIARLRLWLSLVVDEDDFKQIQPLPNLDYKIMQGHSLLEEFEGVRLFDDTLLDGSGETEMQITTLQEEIIRKQQQMLELHARGNRADQLKKKFSKEIKQLQRQVRALREPRNEDAAGHLFDDPRRESREKLRQLKELHQAFFETTSRGKKEQLRARLENLEWEFMEATLREQKKIPALADLRQFRRSNRKPFFLWKLHFVEIFQDKGGFDVVIGNPPYIRIQEIRASAPETVDYYKRRYAAAGKGNYDLYVIFVEHGLSLLGKSGFLSYILPHKFFNAQYGAPLRKLIADGQHLQHVIHFGDQQIFPSATNYTCLLFLSKQPASQCRFIKVEDFEAWSKTGVGQEGEIANIHISSDDWNFDVGKGAALLEKLQQMPIKLTDVADLFVGLQTDADDVFILEVISEKKGILTCESKFTGKHHAFEAGHLKPFLKGALNVRRYALTDVTKRLLFPYENVDDRSMLIDSKNYQTKFPLTWDYLITCKGRLAKRNKGQMGKDWYGYVYKKNHLKFEQPKLLVPAIANGSCFAVDLKGQYYFVGSGGGGGGGYGIVPQNSTKHSMLYVLGLLNSRLIEFFLRRVSTAFRGGYFALTRQYIERVPIRMIDLSDPYGIKQQQQVATLVDYILFMKATISADAPRDQLMVSYFEQLIDALVYELYLPDEIHTAGRQFFTPLITERLPALDEIKGDKLAVLRQIFERLYDRNHIIRQNIFFLDTIESVRIIEGKA